MLIYDSFFDLKEYIFLPVSSMWGASSSSGFFGGRNVFLVRSLVPSMESSKLREFRLLPRPTPTEGVSPSFGFLKWEASLPS